MNSGPAAAQRRRKGDQEGSLTLQSSEYLIFELPKKSLSTFGTHCFSRGSAVPIEQCFLMEAAMLKERAVTFCLVRELKEAMHHKLYFGIGMFFVVAIVGGFGLEDVQFCCIA